ncbi:DUF397 domain-containing protein [Streptomyces sp. NBC_00083]|uniref:DUF397 domain-containing protein n=1 Tax=Streptomyces sp. NBC_00083 TaxID=2975647 RepID=UPI00224C8BED|nr:DUF397 domain-containing protein [Streptomyces sp. NBC_00083]MCX5383784.1 DUF397 domain-containing protein [Streptomyces sp. NBC_00083]
MSAHPAHVPSSTSLTHASWRRSSRSVGMNNCVETARLKGELLAVRDSQRIEGPALLFGDLAWHRFISSLRRAS